MRKVEEENRKLQMVSLAYLRLARENFNFKGFIKEEMENAALRARCNSYEEDGDTDRGDLSWRRTTRRWAVWDLHLHMS